MWETYVFISFWPPIFRLRSMLCPDRANFTANRIVSKLVWMSYHLSGISVWYGYLCMFVCVCQICMSRHLCVTCEHWSPMVCMEDWLNDGINFRLIYPLNTVGWDAVWIRLTVQSAKNRIKPYKRTPWVWDLFNTGLFDIQANIFGGEKRRFCQPHHGLVSRSAASYVALNVDSVTLPTLADTTLEVIIFPTVLVSHTLKTSPLDRRC